METKETLIRIFKDGLQLQSKLRRAGDPIAGNEQATRSHKAFKRLVQNYGDEGRRALMVLFDDTDPEVRLIAAAYLLRFCSEDASNTLNELMQSENGFLSFRASQALKRWEEGTSQLDLCWEDELN